MADPDKKGPLTDVREMAQLIDKLAKGSDMQGRPVDSFNGVSSPAARLAELTAHECHQQGLDESAFLVVLAYRALYQYDVAVETLLEVVNTRPGTPVFVVGP